MAAPTVTARSGGNSGTVDTTTHTITLPTFSVGQLLLVIFGCDQDVTTTVSSGSGWYLLARNINNIATGAVYWKIASGTGDNLTITSESAQQSVHNSYAISGGYYVDAIGGQNTDASVGAITPVDGLGDYLSIVACVGPGVQSGLGAPTGYSNGVLRTPPGADGCTVFSAEAGFTNTDLLSAATITGAAFGSGQNTPNFHIAVSEADPAVHGYPRVYSRETTDLTSTTQTSHPIRMPPGIDVDDLLVTFFTANGNTTIGSASNGWQWQEIDGDQNQSTLSSAAYYAVATATNALTMVTGAACKSFAMTICIKNGGNIIQAEPLAYLKGSATSITHTSGPDAAGQTYFSEIWRKMLFINAFSTDAQDWYQIGTNGVTGFPRQTGASVNYAEWGYGLANDIYWGVPNFGTTKNYVSWYFAVEGKQCNNIEFNGYKFLTFAGTSTNQNITIDTITAPSGGANTYTVQPGDLMLLGFASGSSADRALAVNSTGWTRIDSKRYVNGTTYDVNMTMYWKVMGDTPDTTVQITGTLNNADAGACTLFCFKGVDQSNPIDNVAWTSATGNSSPTPASIDYVTPGSWPIQFVALASASAIGGQLPGINWYYIRLTSNDTNSITTTMNYSRSENIRFVPSSFTNVTSSAVNSWGAYTLSLKPKYAPTTVTWTHEAGTENTFADYTSSLSLIVSELGQKGNACMRVAPNSSTGIVYSNNLMNDKYWVQGRFKANVTQNPTANSSIRVLSLNSLGANNTSYTTAGIRLQISTTGSLSLSAWNDGNSEQLGSNVAINGNTWYWIAFNYDASNVNSTTMTWKLNNVTQNTSIINPAVFRPHRLIGRTLQASGSSNWNGYIYLDNVTYSFTDWPAYPTGRPKIYNGSTWVNKPLKRWTGSAWVEEPMYYWNGTNWEYIT